MSKIKDLVIFGTGGFANELSGLCYSKFNILGFIGTKPKIILKYPYLGNDNLIKKISNNTASLVAIGDPEIRSSIYQKLKKNNKKITSFIHDSCVISDNVNISKGVICYPNSTIHNNVKIGYGSVVNSNVTVGHDTKILKYVNINPGVSIGGNCTISNSTIVGIGASIIQNIKISNNIIIGAGSIVTKNISKKGVYLGVPATLKKN